MPDWGAGPHRRAGGSATDGDAAGAPKGDEATAAGESSPAKEGSGDGEVHYKMQSMKWGLVPFWTKRNPDYASMLKTINCRDDSLAHSGGMWSSMKSRKRCVVVAQGFYEWLTKGPKDKVPHFIKRKDGQLMLMAGLWDCVQYEGEFDIALFVVALASCSADDETDTDQKLYTYTIVTTDSNKQLRFLHDRMPVILDPDSEKLWTWLDPGRHEWSKELQSILKPYEGELEVYPVPKEVGKVGNDSPSFIIPLASKENKSNIANFFTSSSPKKAQPKTPQKPTGDSNAPTPIKSEVTSPGKGLLVSPEKTPQQKPAKGTKRETPDESGNEKKAHKKPHTEEASASVSSPTKTTRGKTTSATKNATKPLPKKAQGGSQKITNFFK